MQTHNDIPKEQHHHPRILLDLPIEDYLNDDLHHSSKHLKAAKKSLKQYYWDFILEKEEEPTGQMLDFGNAFETALLTPNLFDDCVAVKDEEEWVNKALEEKPDLKKPKGSTTYQNLRDQFYEDNKDKLVISKAGAESMEAIEHMLEACRQDANIQKFISTADYVHYQPSFFWADKESGLLMRTRPDIADPNAGYLVDVKTCEDASPQGFSRQVARMEYVIQAALHIEGAEQIGYIDEVKEYYYLAVEKKPPYNAQIFALPPQDRDWIRDQARFLMGEIAQARRENFYPGYTQRVPDPMGIADLDLPVWYRNESIAGQ